MRPSRSDDFLELVRRSRQGRLKVFLGPAAGVGKTYRMLQEAHDLVRRGVDVVIGVVETHGRPDTAALLDGLEAVPLRQIEYRGVQLGELDLDAVLKREPEVVLIDEAAHTNAPGSRHAKRHEDITALLRSGIHVYCAFNVQHLESLGDLVEQATGIKVHETVPDLLLRRADQVVNIDLPPEDLIDRLEAGNVYPSSRVDWAREHFFKISNLEALRELALREVAEVVGRARDGTEAASGSRGRSHERIMLCLSSASSHSLVRRASRMAGRLNAHWYAVYVETPAEAPNRIAADRQRRLYRTQEFAHRLGAEVHHLEARDPVDAIIEFADANGVADIIVGVTRQRWLKQLLGVTVAQRLLARADGYDLHLLTSKETTS